MTTEIVALLTRCANALEATVRLSKEQQSDYRKNALQSFKLQEESARAYRAAQSRAAVEADATHKLLLDQAKRNERSLVLAESEIARLRERDEQYTAYLRAAAERSTETLDTLKTAAGLAAPSYVPENLVQGVPDDQDTD